MIMPHNGTETSKAAANLAKKMAPDQGKQILLAILNSGTKGLTAEEICEVTKISGDSVRPRLLALEKDKKIKRTGRTRNTKSGRKAFIWEPFRNGRNP